MYLATDLQLEETCVVKMATIREGAETDKERFLSEASLLGGLDHPGIPRVMDCGCEGNEYYYVMEWVEGVPLSKAKGLEVDSLTKIFKDSFDILSYIHSRGVIHRDIKPGNLIILPNPESTSGMTVKLIDFGLARFVGQGRITSHDNVVGTLNYMAPEQLIGGEIDSRADLYSMGATMYYSLTGSLPYSKNISTKLAYQLVSQAVDPPSTINRKVPPELDNIVMLLLRKSPNERVQTATEVSNMLAALTVTIPVSGNVLVISQPDMIGRNEQSKILFDAFDLSRQKSQIVVVTGPFGSGKSRLVDEFANLAQLTSSVLLRARGHSMSSTMPLEGLKQLAFDISNYNLECFQEIDQSTKNALVALEPKLARSLGFAGRPSNVNAQEYVDALAQIISRFDKPVAIILEDVDRIDTPSLQACQKIKDLSRVLIILTCEESKSDERLSEIYHKNPDVVKVELKNLTGDQIKAFAESALHINEVPNSLLIDLEVRFNGNPYLMIHYLKVLSKNAKLAVVDGKLSYKSSDERMPFSPNFLSQSLAQLSQKARIILNFAAVLGRPFEFGLASFSLDLSKEETLSALDELIGMAFLKRRQLTLDAVYEFAYPPFSQDILSISDPALLKELCSRVARELEHGAPISDIAAKQIAILYREAGNLSKSVEWAEEYAKRMMNVQPLEAQEWLSYIQQMSFKHGRKDLLIKVKMAEASKASQSNNLPLASRLYEDALELAKTTCNLREFARAAIPLAKVWFAENKIDKIEVVIDEALHIVPRNDHPSEYFDLLLYKTQLCRFRMKLEQAEMFVKLAVEFAKSHLPERQSEAKHMQLFTDMTSDRYPKPMSESEELLQSAKASGNGKVVANILFQRGLLLYLQGDYQASVDCFDESVKEPDLSFSYDQAMANAYKVRSLYCLGDFQNAIKAHGQLASSISDFENKTPLAISEAYVVNIELLKNGWQDAFPMAISLINRIDEPMPSSIRLLTDITHGTVLWNQKRYDEALEHYVAAYENAVSSNLDVEVAFALSRSLPLSPPNLRSTKMQVLIEAALKLPLSGAEFATYKLDAHFCKGVALMHSVASDPSIYEASLKELFAARSLAMKLGHKIMMGRVPLAIAHVHALRSKSTSAGRQDIDMATKMFFEAEFVFTSIGVDYAANSVREQTQRALGFGYF